MRFVNEFGNVVIYTEDERKIEQLKAKGYKQCELPTKEEKAPKVEGAKKNVKQRKKDAEGNI